jgi:hypothetical protein
LRPDERLQFGKIVRSQSVGQQTMAPIGRTCQDQAVGRETGVFVQRGQSLIEPLGHIREIEQRQQMAQFVRERPLARTDVQHDTPFRALRVSRVGVRFVTIQAAGRLAIAGLVFHQHQRHRLIGHAVEIAAP